MSAWRACACWVLFSGQSLLGAALTEPEPTSATAATTAVAPRPMIQLRRVVQQCTPASLSVGLLIQVNFCGPFKHAARTS